MASQIIYYDAPARVEVYTNKLDGSSFVESFPCEKANTDYFRSGVGQVGRALQPLVVDTVKANGVVEVGKHGEDLKAVVEAVRTEYAPKVLVVVGAQDNTLKTALGTAKWCAQDVYVVQGAKGKLAPGDINAVEKAYTDGKIVFLVEATCPNTKKGGGPGPTAAASGRATPAPAHGGRGKGRGRGRGKGRGRGRGRSAGSSAPAAAKVVVGYQGKELKALKNMKDKTGNLLRKIVFQSQDPKGIIGCDTYALVKHVKHHIVEYAKRLGCTNPKTLKTDPKKLKKLKTALDEVMNPRNGLAHMTLDSAKKCLEELFKHAKDVVKRVDGHFKNKKNYFTMNMENLEKQWQTHTASKWQRLNAHRLYVGSKDHPGGKLVPWPPGATKEKLMDHLNEEMRRAGFCTMSDPPVISCPEFKERYAFVELRSVQATNDGLSLTGMMPFLGGDGELEIERPKNYDPPDPEIAAKFLARGLEDVAFALGKSLADDAALKNVWSQLGTNAQEVLRVLCPAGKAPAESDAPRTVTPVRVISQGGS